MAEERGAPLTQFSEGGGLIDDADVTIVGAKWCQWDYKGKAPMVFALRVDVRDDEGNVHDDYLSGGDLKNFVPSQDGSKAVPVGKEQFLNVNTNAVSFLLSVMNADTRGELAAKMKATDAFVPLLVGLRCHVIRKPQPKRPGIVSPEVQAGQQPAREAKVLNVEKIIAYPWEGAPVAAQPPAGAVQAGPAVAAPAAAPANGGAAGPYDDDATGWLCTLAAAAGGSIKNNMVAGKLYGDAGFKALDPAKKNGILGTILRPDFLSAAGRPWKFDSASGMITLG